MSRPAMWAYVDGGWRDTAYDDIARRRIPEDDDPPAAKPRPEGTRQAAHRVLWDISPAHEEYMNAQPQPDDDQIIDLYEKFGTEPQDVKIQFWPRREMSGTCPYCGEHFSDADLTEFEISSGETRHTHKRCGWVIQNTKEAATVRSMLFGGGKKHG